MYINNIIYFLNVNYWNILYILLIINKLIEFPLILLIHCIFIYIYLKINKKKNILKIILILTILPLLSLTIKKIIKNNLFIYRPYNNILKKKKINKYIPLWIKKYWKKKKDSSFPSGHTIYANFWIIIYKKKKNIWFIKYIIIILKLIIISRILLYLHRITDIIFSILINVIIKNITFKYIKL